MHGRRGAELGTLRTTEAHSSPEPSVDRGGGAGQPLHLNTSAKKSNNHGGVSAVTLPCFCAALPNSLRSVS